MIALNNGKIHNTGERYTMIKMIATTRPVVSRRLESMLPKAPKRSAKIAPIPVTWDSNPEVFANSLT